MLARRGVELMPVLSDFAEGYQENPPVATPKLSELTAAAEAAVGSCAEIESPEALALNKAVARFIGSARTIVNVGSASAAFERFVAVDRSLDLVANVHDETFAQWAREVSSHGNVHYRPGGIPNLLDEYGCFDLAVAIDVIDREQDFGEFLRGLSQLGDRVIVTAVNKARDRKSLAASPPAERRRIREWTAGELYWVLKAHFDRVELFGMPDPVVPHTVRVGPLSRISSIVAVCGSLEP
jgi:hypothetical protein